jgi:hypothetical protein
MRIKNALWKTKRDTKRSIFTNIKVGFFYDTPVTEAAEKSLQWNDGVCFLAVSSKPKKRLVFSKIKSAFLKKQWL